LKKKAFTFTPDPNAVPQIHIAVAIDPNAVAVASVAVAIDPNAAAPVAAAPVAVAPVAEVAPVAVAPRPSVVPMRFLCIGCGSMGLSILHGLSRYKPENLELHAYNRSKSCYKYLEPKQVICHADIHDAVRQADFILLTLSPEVTLDILKDILPSIPKNTVIISAAAHVSLKSLMRTVQNRWPVVRILPNIPTSIGEGTFAICYDDPLLSAPQAGEISSLFENIGKVIPLPEKRFASFIAIFGAGPVYIFYCMEAIAEAAVHLGFDRPEANALSKRLFDSTSKFASKASQSPTTLREHVCSPAGINIQLIQHLDQHALKGYLVEAILKANELAQDG